MPEYPEMELYRVALERELVGREIERAQLLHPFFLRSVGLRVDALNGRTVVGIERIAKRTVLAFSGDVFAVIHLMIAGRFKWRAKTSKGVGKAGLLRLDVEHGSLFVTEAGSKRRASLHLVEGRAGLAEHDRGGLDLFDIDSPAFLQRLRSERHTLKRALADPRLFSAIGNAWSDEILLFAKLSPFARSESISDEDGERLFRVAREVLAAGRERLLAEAGETFPEKVTAFHPSLAAHGKFGEPCPVCDSPIQRIVYAENECNYCARCQTGGKILKDRALSRLLHDDWPRSLDEL